MRVHYGVLTTTINSVIVTETFQFKKGRLQQAHLQVPSPSRQVPACGKISKVNTWFCSSCRGHAWVIGKWIFLIGFSAASNSGHLRCWMVVTPTPPTILEWHASSYEVYLLAKRPMRRRGDAGRCLISPWAKKISLSKPIFVVLIHKRGVNEEIHKNMQQTADASLRTKPFVRDIRFNFITVWGFQLYWATRTLYAHCKQTTVFFFFFSRAYSA